MQKDPLEFDTVKEYIRLHVVSEHGHKMLVQMKPFDSWEEAEYMWTLSKEMLDLHSNGNEPRLSPIPEIKDLIVSLKEGSILEGPDLITISWALEDSQRLRDDLSSSGSGPSLSELSEKITPLGWLVKEINLQLKETGEVSDDANPVLKDLRRRYSSGRSSIIEALEKLLKRLRPRHVLMEDIITLRNDRFVIPLKHNYGKYIKGIVHDYSRKRHTVYVEPISTVEMNNRLNQLKASIKDEEIKMLRYLTSLVREASDQIDLNLKTYGKLDLINACSLWAQETHATIPALKQKGIYLKDARHPVLLKRLGEDGCIPIDIIIPEDSDCLVISGPNADGKTVALKTLGLLVTMAKAGLAIPADKSSYIPPVGQIWIEMDSSQDIKNDLSSFTAHAQSLKFIYEHSRPQDLVLLDEPGGGTDPDQGGALAVALIDALRKKHTYTIATSHSHLVKLYGLTMNNILSASVAYDEERLLPLYKLKYGIAGESKAFDILKVIGFPSLLLDEATGILARDTTSPLTKAMEDLRKVDEMKSQVSEQLRKAEELRRLAETKISELDKIKLESALKYKRILEGIEEMAKKTHPKETLKQVQNNPELKDLKEVLDNIVPLAVKTLKIEAGQRVRVKGSNTEGTVNSITSNVVEIHCGTKKIKLGIDQIEAIENDNQRQEDNYPLNATHIINKPMVLPVLVVGMHIEEALPVVEKAIDNALLSGQNTLEIIHGSGTGVLKAAIRNYLRELPFVNAIKDGPIMEGGGNKTIVEIKQDE